MRSTYFLFYKLHTFCFHVRSCMILAFYTTKQRKSRYSMNNATNEKHGCMWMMQVEVLQIFMQDMGLNQFRFFNMVHDILVKVKLEVTRTSTILNVFGSRRSSDVTRFIFCPNFCKMVTSILQLDLMNLFVKARAWFNPIPQRMAILIANTSTTFHRDERLENTHAMHGKCNYEVKMPEETSFPS